MSKVDWSKAPEGATHAFTKKYDGPNPFFKVRGIEIFHYDGEKFKETSDQYIFFGPSMVTTGYVEERPAVWSGEGLPPVGAVCEDDAGNEVLIVAHHVNGTHAIFAESLTAGLLYYGEAGEFRPLRTPEQIAAEERENAVEAMLALDPYLLNTPTGMMSRADFCRALHDAGYRLQEKPE